jgi:ribosomal protein L36
MLGHIAPMDVMKQSTFLRDGKSFLFSSNTPPSVVPVRSYKVKVALKRRCPSCYRVRRGNRLFIECTAKPRHKQMQKMHRNFLFKED